MSRSLFPFPKSSVLFFFLKFREELALASSRKDSHCSECPPSEPLSSLE